jgi:hypothetical protein
MADPSGAHDVSGRNVAAAQDARGWPEQYLTVALRGGRSSDEASRGRGLLDVLAFPWVLFLFFAFYLLRCAARVCPERYWWSRAREDGDARAVVGPSRRDRGRAPMGTAAQRT